MGEKTDRVDYRFKDVKRYKWKKCLSILLYYVSVVLMYIVDNRDSISIVQTPVPSERFAGLVLLENHENILYQNLSYQQQVRTNNTMRIRSTFLVTDQEWGKIYYSVTPACDSGC